MMNKKKSKADAGYRAGGVEIIKAKTAPKDEPSSAKKTARVDLRVKGG